MEQKQYLSGISIKYNSTEYTGSITIGTDCDKNVIKLQVGVNGNYDCNDFEISKSEDWVEIKRIRNYVDVIINPNGIQDRYTTVMFMHKLNRNVYFELKIEQDMPDYSIKACETETGTYLSDIEFTNFELFDTTKKSIYFKYEYGEPYLSAITEYAKKTSDDSDYVKVNYDGGIKLEQITEKHMEITSYGKCNLYYDHYYVLIFKNKKNTQEKSTVTIKYKQEEDILSF